MSNVILFDQRNREQRTPRTDGVSAEIVIFHGVRIERLSEDAVQSSMTRNTRRIPAAQNQATAEELE